MLEFNVVWEERIQGISKTKAHTNRTDMELLCKQRPILFMKLIRRGNNVLYKGYFPYCKIKGQTMGSIYCYRLQTVKQCYSGLQNYY